MALSVYPTCRYEHLSRDSANSCRVAQSLKESSELCSITRSRGVVICLLALVSSAYCPMEQLGQAAGNAR
jgi:hypothetical protein